MKELINKYLEMLNKAEITLAALIKVGEKEQADRKHIEICMLSKFLHDLARKEGLLVCSTFVTEKFMCVGDVCYEKTIII